MTRLPARAVCAILVTLAISSGAFGGPTTQDPNTYQYTHDETTYTWSYGYDPSKWINGVTGFGSHIVELARDPVLLTSGTYAGAYEYLFDMYDFGSQATGTTYEIGGLDNSKILNKVVEIYGMPFLPGKITEVWSIGGSVDLTACQSSFGPSYDDSAGGWTDAGLTHPCAKNTDNPHSFSEYRSAAYGGSCNFYADLDVSALPGVDEIVMSRSGAGATSADGLLFTVRVVLEDPVIPVHLGGTDDIWWTMASHGAGTRYDVLGEFDVFSTILGDFDLDGDVDNFDIDMLCDAIYAGLGEPEHLALYDISGPGEDGVPDGLIDINDLDYHVHVLVEISTSLDTGTEYGDFNLDGMVDTTDLTRLAANYGDGDWNWDDGNANRYIDTDIDNTDLTILAAYYGFGEPDVVPEPASAGLLLLGASAVLRRRRKAKR